MFGPLPCDWSLQEWIIVAVDYRVSLLVRRQAGTRADHTSMQTQEIACRSCAQDRSQDHPSLIKLFNFTIFYGLMLIKKYWVDTNL